MFTSGICTLVLLAVASVNGSPTQYDKRDPQFSVNLPNRLPVSGNFNGFTISQGPNGNSIITFGNSTTGGRTSPFSFFGGNTGTGTSNTTTNNRPFPFNLLPFKRDEEIVKREPQFSFNFPNRLPVTGNLPFGINIAQGADGNSIGNFGNATTGARPFPFNFKRDEQVEVEASEEIEKRDPQFSFNFPNRLPVTGNLPFGINIAQGANGNSIGTFGNATTGTRPFPFNFKRDEQVEVEVEAGEEIEKRDPQFSFNFPNRLPVTGNLPFGINIAQGANGNSIGNFGNATTGARPFPFNFKREE